MITKPEPSSSLFVSTDSSSKYEEPKCSHCHEELDECSKPDDITFLENFVCLVVFFFLLANLVACTIGIIDASYDRGGTHAFGTKRYDYVIPGYFISFVGYRWMTNGTEFIKYEKIGD